MPLDSSVGLAASSRPRSVSSASAVVLDCSATLPTSSMA